MTTVASQILAVVVICLALALAVMYEYMPGRSAASAVRSAMLAGSSTKFRRKNRRALTK